MNDDRDDHTLVRAMAAGEEAALDALYARHGARLLAYLLGQLGERALAEEALQDVMLAAWKGAPHFRAESRVTTWLIGIARYRALNVRRGQRPHHREAASLDTLGSLADGEGDDPFAHELVVRTALAALPAHQRETLELIFYHQLSGDEAAAVLGVAPGTVKSRLHRALAALRARLHPTYRPLPAHDSDGTDHA
jgi:RNA polymerase sigma-70 factor (ECF subfamily)